MSVIKIINWNVNSIKSRLVHVLELLQKEGPDIVLLQEIKCENGNFPYQEIQQAGYRYVEVFGQKTYNGVAIISRHPLSHIQRGLGAESHIEEQLAMSDDLSATGGLLDGLENTKRHREARFIECIAKIDEGCEITVASIYVPNGAADSRECQKKIPLTQSRRFKYKMAFFNDLRHYIRQKSKLHGLSVYAGDLNVAPLDIDVYSVKNWTGQICFLPEERERFFDLIGEGYYDAFRGMNPDQQLFSWYDYRRSAFEQGKGIRIDHYLVSPKAMDAVTSAKILHYYRGLEKPSDHVPVELNLKIE